MSSDEGLISAMVSNAIILIVFIFFLINNIKANNFTQSNHKVAYPIFFALFIIFSAIFGITYVSKNKELNDKSSNEDKNLVKSYLGLSIIDALLLIPIIVKSYFIYRK